MLCKPLHHDDNFSRGHASNDTRALQLSHVRAVAILPSTLVLDCTQPKSPPGTFVLACLQAPPACVSGLDCEEEEHGPPRDCTTGRASGRAIYGLCPESRAVMLSLVEMGVCGEG